MASRWRAAAGWGIVGCTIGLLIAGAVMVVANISDPKPTIIIGGTAIKVTVARTDAELLRGLGGVDSIPMNEGMLFVFPKEGGQHIWMKDMKITLDIVWINADKRVVHIERNVRPDSYPRVYSSPVPAKYVLEVAAGTAADAQITDGSNASFQL